MQISSKISNKLTIACALILTLLFCISGCSREKTGKKASNHPTTLVVTETADTVTCRLPNGGVTVIPKHPQRTVVLLTSLLNLWVEAGGKAVGRCSGKINVPPGALDIPELGSFNNPNVRKLDLLYIVICTNSNNI